jgi:hypothetical protein
MSVTIQQARRVKDRLAKTLADAKGLVGLGITRIGDDYAVKVNFSGEPEARVPASLSGVPVRVEVVGKIRKRAPN